MTQLVLRDRRGWPVCASLFCILVLSACATPSASNGRAPGRKVVILGFDGADPALLSRWVSEGHLPNIRRLGQTGTVQPLATTQPPQSAVAWASLATGMNPGRHGVFDVFEVDRKHYAASAGFERLEGPDFLLRLFPVSSPRPVHRLQQAPFYQIVSQAGVQTSVLKVPLAVPSSANDACRLLSGSGFMDACQTGETFFYFATDLTQWDLSGKELGGNLVQLGRRGNSMRTRIEGPHDPRYDDGRRLSIPLKLELTPEETAVRITVQGKQQTVAQGSWSDWFEFRFQGGMFVDRRGIGRFYVLETYPEVRLYLEPISPDPRKPPLPISSPKGLAADLAARVGLFKTLQWSDQLWGLNEERIDEAVFLEDLFRNMGIQEAMLVDELDRRDPQLVVTVFSAIDSVSHMFFRLMDPEHPRYEASLAEGYGNAILRTYRRMDEMIGSILGRLGTQDTLIVVSDHGFESWSREFNANAWLVENGYLVTTGTPSPDPEARPSDSYSGQSSFPRVDWRRSRAYGLGAGGIFINVVGREGQGSIQPGLRGYEQLRDEIRIRLLEFRDPDTGRPVVQSVYRREELYEGPRLEQAPDLVVSLRDGYRASWQTARGAVPETIVAANLKKWSGDHATSDHSSVPGIFLSNRRTSGADYTVLDIAPTILEIFDIPIPTQMDGKPIRLLP